MTTKQIDKLWNRFHKIAEGYGYDCYPHNDRNMGIGTTCCQSDRFVPIINLSIQPELKYKHKKEVAIPMSMTLFVKDRNGNTVIDGPYCAVYSLNDCPDFNEKFEDMCTYVFDKYSAYSRENRLDFAFNELTEERKEW